MHDAKDKKKKIADLFDLAYKKMYDIDVRLIVQKDGRCTVFVDVMKK